MNEVDRLIGLGYEYVACSFDDADILEHFGIKGQRWGVRRYQNPDGTLTEEGKRRYGSDKAQKQLSELADKAGYKALDKLYNDKRIRMASKSVKDLAMKNRESAREYEKLEDEFYRDSDLYKEWAIKAADKRWSEMDPDVDSWTKEEVRDWYLYDDGDQGDVVEMYRSSGEPKAKKMQEAFDRMIEDSKAINKACEEYADVFLGSYGDKPISYLPFKGAVRTKVTSAIKDVADKLIYDEEHDWRGRMK